MRAALITAVQRYPVFAVLLWRFGLHVRREGDGTRYSGNSEIGRYVLTQVPHHLKQGDFQAPLRNGSMRADREIGELLTVIWATLFENV